jgi:hypothetical protein
MSAPREELAAILIQKAKVYDEFASVTELLRQALDDDRMGAVVEFIKQRDKLMRDCAGLDRRSHPHRHSAPSPQNQGAERLAEHVSRDLGAKLKQIMAVDTECRTIAARKYEEARKELRRFSQAKEGIQGYALKAKRPPKFLSIET